MPSAKFRKTLTDCTDADYRRYRENFDNLIERPLTLPDLVPCVNGVPVEKPITWDMRFKDVGVMLDNFHNEYAEAKAKCLFEGFEVKNWNTKDGISKTVFNGNVHAFWFDDASQTWNNAVGKTVIEDYVGYELPLTQKSINEIYGR